MQWGQMLAPLYQPSVPAHAASLGPSRGKRGLLPSWALNLNISAVKNNLCQQNPALGNCRTPEWDGTAWHGTVWHYCHVLPQCVVCISFFLLLFFLSPFFLFFPFLAIYFFSFFFKGFLINFLFQWWDNEF